MFVARLRSRSWCAEFHVYATLHPKTSGKRSRREQSVEMGGIRRKAGNGGVVDFDAGMRRFVRFYQ